MILKSKVINTDSSPPIFHHAVSSVIFRLFASVASVWWKDFIMVTLAYLVPALCLVTSCW